MGKKAKWFGAVKKVFNPESKEKKQEKLRRKLAASAPNPPDLIPSVSSEANVSVSPALTLPPAHTEEVKVPAPVPVIQEEEHAATATEAFPAAPQAAVVASSRMSKELAAIKIQTAFRGYLARRALRALRGLVRLKSLVEGNSVKRQATSTLRCMQTLARVQSQIRSRRLKMSEENQALQRQLLLKQELESLRMGEQWDDSLQSKEQIKASLVSRQEAGIRRERALAYAFSHQWKSTSRSANPMFVDPNNLHWGWSWLERWMAAKPWEGRNGTTDKESNIDRMSVNSTSLNLGEGEITKAYSRRDSNPDKPSPTTPKLTRPASRLSPSTPSGRATPVFAGKKSATPKNGVSTQGDDDARSMFSVQSERPRRHSIGTSTVQDDVSLSGSPSVPSYMASTRSARAKSRLQSPTLTDEGAETPPEKGGWSVGSVKKKLSFPAGMVPPSPMRRHSGPPKVQQVAIESNGGSSKK